MQTETQQIERLAIFSILMENNDGIVGKSPDYILEKFDSAISVLNPAGLLDEKNEEKLKEWRRIWRLTEE